MSGDFIGLGAHRRHYVPPVIASHSGDAPPERPPPGPHRFILPAAAFVAFAVILGLIRWGCVRRQAVVEEIPPAPPAAAGPTNPPPIRYSFPTARTNLLAPDAAERGEFMPTASGRPESALYGSVRTQQSGRSVYASFHEGVDIAPLGRDRAGHATDDVLAVADGRFAYANRRVGNSNYGLYVVLLHDDPAGPVYSLYAHLAAIDPALKVGAAVKAGDRLGRMGNTPEGTIPVVRSHLHLEIGVICSPRFDRWFQAKKLKPNHGLYNGMNLLGFNPLAPFETQAAGCDFSLVDHLDSIKTAFEVVLATRARPPYFDDYPSRWVGPDADGAAWLAVSDSGIPLAGRTATAEEKAALGRRKAVVLHADPEVLGRNGRRIVVRDNTGWRLGQAGEQWLDILTYR